MGCVHSTNQSQLFALHGHQQNKNKESLQQYYAYLTALPKLFASSMVQSSGGAKYLCTCSVQNLEKTQLFGAKKNVLSTEELRTQPSVISQRTNLMVSEDMLDRSVMVLSCTDTRSLYFEKVLSVEELFEIREVIDVNHTVGWWKFFRAVKHCFLSKRVFLEFEHVKRKTGYGDEDDTSEISVVSDTESQSTNSSVMRSGGASEYCNLTMELQLPTLGRTNLTLKLKKVQQPSYRISELYVEPLYEFYMTKSDFGSADKIERLERQVRLYREKIQIMKDKSKDYGNSDDMDFEPSPTSKTLLSTPHKNIMKFLNDIRQKLEENGGMSDMEKSAFQNVIELLKQDNMYSHDFNKAAKKEVDKEVLTWLKHRFGVDKTKDTEVSQSYSRSLYLKTEQDFHLNTTELDKNKSREAIKNMFNKVDDWNFDVFTLEELTDGQTLFVTGYTLFMKYDLFSKFNIAEKTMLNFLRELEAGYHPNPYHNSMHAADVVQVLHHIIHRGNLSRFMRDEDILAALISALIHDFDHPGLNNSFQIKTLSYLAVLYNDRSVMENHHCAQAFELLKAPQFDIFCNMERAQKRDIRETIIGMVLATDMSEHGKYIAKFKQRIEANADFSSKEDLRLALQVAVKYADVSNPTRPTNLYLKWAGRLSDEFYRQGDKERELNIPIDPLMDREKHSMARGQKMFINYIITPMLESFSVLLPSMSFANKFVNDNLLYWEKRKQIGDEVSDTD